MTDKRLRPKLAASLILTRTSRSGKTELLFGRRSSKHVFMPNKYVFPGGRVDRTDGFAPLVRELSPDVEAVLTRSLPPRRARAAAAAAIRETAEETGLLIAETDPKESGRPDWQPFDQKGVSPTAGPLNLITRAITPPGRSRRFDTWFFRADEADLHEASRLKGSGELEDLGWVAFDKAHDLDIPIITRFVLGELKRQLQGETELRYVRVSAKGPHLKTL